MELQASLGQFNSDGRHRSISGVDVKQTVADAAADVEEVTGVVQRRIGCSHHIEHLLEATTRNRCVANRHAHFRLMFIIGRVVVVTVVAVTVVVVVVVVGHAYSGCKRRTYCLCRSCFCYCCSCSGGRGWCCMKSKPHRRCACTLRGQMVEIVAVCFGQNDRFRQKKAIDLIQTKRGSVDTLRMDQSTSYFAQTSELLFGACHRNVD